MSKLVSKCLKSKLQLLFNGLRSSPFSPFSGRGPLAIHKAPGTLSDWGDGAPPSHPANYICGC